jgi:hypothetical protein
VRHVVTYLLSRSRPQAELSPHSATKNRLIALRFHLRVGLEQAFLTAQRVASKAPENGRLKRVIARWKLLELSKSGVVALRFLGFLLRINFDNMLARCNIGGRLLPDRRKIISG